MKAFFSVYPHCFLTANDNSVLIFNPRTKDYVIGRDSEMALFVRTRTSYVLQQNDNNLDFLKEAESKGLGYFIHSNSQPPYLAFQEFSFLSSFEKNRKALGENPSWKLPSLIKGISIHLNNVDLKKNSSTCIQFDYPEYCEETHNLATIESVFPEISNFPALECIRLCGDIDNTLLYAIKKLDHIESQLVVRTSANNINKVLRIRNLFPSLKIEIIAADTEDIFKVRQYALLQNGIQVFYLISNPKKLKYVQETLESCCFIPLLYNKREQFDLISQMRLSLDDIMTYNSNMYDCLSKVFFHKECFGNISFDLKGNVFCQNERIGNICNSSAINMLGNWLRRADCLWMLTRNKFPRCRNCILAALCPSVSIYERQGIIPTACNNDTYEYLQRFV